MPRRAAPHPAAPLLLLVALAALAGCSANPDAKRLYDDLLSNYNKLVRPVLNVSDALTVRIKLKLSQLIDVVSPSPPAPLPVPCSIPPPPQLKHAFASVTEP